MSFPLVRFHRFFSFPDSLHPFVFLSTLFFSTDISFDQSSHFLHLFHLLKGHPYFLEFSLNLTKKYSHTPNCHLFLVTFITNFCGIFKIMVRIQIKADLFFVTDLKLLLSFDEKKKKTFLQRIFFEEMHFLFVIR